MKLYSHDLKSQPGLLLTLLLLSRFSRVQLCCDPIDGSPPGSPVPGILQARTPEWVAISFSNAWRWKVKVKSLSRVLLLATPWTAACQAPLSMGFSRQEYWSGVPLPSLTINPSWALFHRHASFLPLLSLQIIFASFYSEKRSHQTTNSLCFLPPAQQHALSALIFSALPPVIMELLSWLILSLVLDRMLSLSPRNFIFFFQWSRLTF